MTIASDYLATSIKGFQDIKLSAEKAIAQLTDEQIHYQPDLNRKITLRQEPHTVLNALNRQLMHYSHHAGQIVYLSKHLAGSNWKTLSIPRGKSGDYLHTPPKK